MNWDDNFCTCPAANNDDNQLTMEKVLEMREIIAKFPPILVEFRVSCDVSCEIVCAIDKLPREKAIGHPFYSPSGIPVKEDAMISRNRAILKFSDGSRKLLIKDELAGMFLTIGDDIPSVRTYFKLIDSQLGRRSDG